MHNLHLLKFTLFRYMVLLLGLYLFFPLSCPSLCEILPWSLNFLEDISSLAHSIFILYFFSFFHLSVHQSARDKQIVIHRNNRLLAIIKGQTSNQCKNMDESYMKTWRKTNNLKYSIYMIVWRRGNYRNRNQISDYQDPQVEVGDLVHKDTY